MSTSWDRGGGVLPTTHRFMKAEEYYEMPEGPPYFQLIEGELFMSPSPNYYHQEIILNFAVSLRQFLQRSRLGKVVIAPFDVELDPENIYQPDLYFVRRDRLSSFTKQGLKGAPDFVIEVISGSAGRLDRGPKKAALARFGTLEFWAALPRTRSVEVYKLAESVDVPALELVGGGTLRTNLLPGWEMSLEEIFAE